MKKKAVFSTELAYVLAILTMALGAALTVEADFGVSMVVAPAYLLHLKISQYLPFFTFGMAEYATQAVALLLLALVLRKFKLSSLLSFATAVLYGLALDLAIWLVGFLPWEGLAWRIVCYVLGLPICSMGVSLFFHTYLPPEAYELFVRELAMNFRWDMNKTKTVYDLCSCLLAVILSFCFFGLWHFEGVKWGTIVCALINGGLIGLCTKLLDRRFDFRDSLPWRSFFSR